MKAPNPPLKVQLEKLKSGELRHCTEGNRPFTCSASLVLSKDWRGIKTGFFLVERTDT